MVGIEERDYEQPKSTSSLDSSLGNQKVVEINNSELLKEVFSVDEKMFQIAKNLLAKHVPDITQELLNWLKTNGKEEIAKFIWKSEKVQERGIKNWINKYLEESKIVYPAFQEWKVSEIEYLDKDNAVEQNTEHIRLDVEELVNSTREKGWDMKAQTDSYNQGNDEYRERGEKIKESHQNFSPHLQKETAQHPELAPKQEELQKTKQTLLNSERWKSRERTGLSENVVDDYLLGYIYQQNASAKGISLSPEFSSSFKDFQNALNLPDGLLAQVNIQIDAPTASVASFANSAETEKILFDPETWSSSIKNSYEANREQNRDAYNLLDKELDNEQLVEQYGNEEQKQLFRDLTALLNEINTTHRLATPEEQRFFQQRNPLKKQLLEKQSEFQEAAKLAMGRTLFSSQATQHCQWLNSAFGSEFVFNPANAFEMKNKTLTTTVKSAQGNYPFKIRTNAAQPNTIQISQFLSLSPPLQAGGTLPEGTVIGFGKEDSFVDIHYEAPSEEQLLATMITSYDSNLSDQPKGNLTLIQRYEQVQSWLQSAISKMYVNTDFIKTHIEQQMHTNTVAQQRIDDRESVMESSKNSPFGKEQITKDSKGSSQAFMECLGLATEKLPAMTREEINDLKECSRLIRDIKHTTREKEKNQTTMGKYFFTPEITSNPDQLAQLRKLVLGGKGQYEKPLLGQFKTFLETNGNEQKDPEVSQGFSELKGKFDRYKEEKEKNQGLADVVVKLDEAYKSEWSIKVFGV